MKYVYGLFGSSAPKRPYRKSRPTGAGKFRSHFASLVRYPKPTENSQPRRFRTPDENKEIMSIKGNVHTGTTGMPEESTSLRRAVLTFTIQYAILSPEY